MVATPGQGPDRTQAVSYTDLKVWSLSSSHLLAHTYMHISNARMHMCHRYHTHLHYVMYTRAHTTSETLMLAVDFDDTVDVDAVDVINLLGCVHPTYLHILGM